MGGAGFGQGFTQGLQQAQDRQMQFQELKLRQDLAKFQQKHMETQDAMQQLQLQSLQKKIQFESGMGGQMNDVSGSPPLGPNDQGPMPQQSPEIDRHKLTSLLISAKQAGQDPDQLLELMSLGDPRIQKIRESLMPEKFVQLGEGETLVSGKTGEVKAKGQPKAHTLTPGSTLVREGQPDIAAPPKPPEFSQPYQDAVAVASQREYGRQMTPTEYIAADPVRAEKLRQTVRVEEPSAVAGARAAAVIDVEGKKLLSPTEASTLGVPFGTTHDEAKGILPINAAQREALAHYDTARVIINDIKQYSDKVNTASGGLRGRAEQAKKLWGGWTQSDTNAAMLMSKAGELASVARSLGEKGALANQDVARAAALIPGVSDTMEVSQLKLRDMMKIIDEGEANYRKSLGVDARQQTKSPKPAQVKEKPVDPLASIPVPKGLTPQQEQLWRESYMKQKQTVQQKMKPQVAGTPSYEMGTSYVPQTGPANLHQGEMVIPKQEADTLRQQGFGKREDGTEKGMGYFGLLRSQDPKARPGTFSSELSYNSTVDGKELFYPILSPNLSLVDITHIMSGKEPTDAMHQKAINHALQRIRQGLSPFAGEGEQLPLPTR